ncbi:hypothetical protein LshimejAT787_1000290 [Lyophyllum shimeji]|uniref:Uncharacterized protein n=1 Tax=Lyophyllum shimeji TaxID=47721 RepID=A0A9P3PTV3_LYOSH|nr:hypothetical protein LshimejAT787_1000290 [Lyophyllum shimeji]
MLMVKAPLATLSVLTLLFAMGDVGAAQNVLTAERVFHTLVDQSPYLVDRTATVVWTQSPSISDTGSSSPTATAPA